MIPVNRPKTPKKSLQYTKKCLKSGWLSSLGSYVTEFEQSFAKYIGVKYAVSVNSGTTALHTALLGLGIGSGDEVILPASTIGSCYFAIWYVAKGRRSSTLWKLQILKSLSKLVSCILRTSLKIVSRTFSPSYVK